MAPSEYPDVVFSVHDTGADIVRERPRPGAGAWTVFGLACLVSAVGGAGLLILVGDLLFAGARLRELAWLSPPAVLVLGAWLAVHALGERLTGRASAGATWALGAGLSGFGAALVTPIVLSWDEIEGLPRVIATAVPGSLVLVGVLALGRAVVLTRGALHRQARMRELRARGRRVAGVVERVRFLQRWASSLPEFEVVVSDAERRLTARLLTIPEQVPLPGTRLWVWTDAAAPEDTDVLIELDTSAPVAFDTRAADYRQPSGDGGGGA